jgi:hypothetical protein
VKCPLCLFQSPKLSDAGCVHSREPQLWNYSVFKDIRFNVWHLIYVSSCKPFGSHCTWLSIAYSHLFFFFWSLFGFQVIRVATYMGGSSTSSIYTTRHTHNLDMNSVYFPLRDSLARQTIVASYFHFVFSSVSLWSLI